MLNNVFLSFALFKLKNENRGAAMTEYAILLAFVAAIAGISFYVNIYDLVPGDDMQYKGQSLFGSIYASVLNVVTVFFRM